MIKKYLYIILLGLFSTITAIATPYCDIRKFSIADGLAANTISDIKQGKDKLMWFATWNGLSYYDGYSFHTFRDDPDGVSVLSTNRILSIQPTTANNVWCITQDRKLYLYDTHLCQFQKSSNQIKEKFNVDFRADHIYDIGGGNTWITSTNSDYLLRTNDTDVLDIELIRVGQKGLKSGKVYYIYGDKKHREWILTDKGTTIYGKKFSTAVPYKWIREVGEYVFLATENGKVVVVDEKNQTTTVPLPKGITHINELKNTGYQLLLATNLGVVIYNPRTFKSEIINIQSPSQPLAEVQKLYVDDYGMVWAFTNGMGVTLVNPKTNEKRWLFADQPDPVDRTSSSKFFITQDENHTLWVIPNQGTFSYYDRKTGQLVPYLLRSNSSGNFRIPMIEKFCLTDQAVLWITGIHDLTLIGFKNHHYTLNKLNSGESEVRAITALANGNQLYGHKNGCIMVTDIHYNKLGYFSPSGNITSEQVPFSPAGIYCLFVDTNNRLWIGTQGDGLYLFTGGKYYHFLCDPNNPASLPNNNIYDVKSDRQGRIWIATYGGGIALANIQADNSIHFTSIKNGLAWDKNLFHKTRRITCTNDGVILVGTTDGLITFSDNFKDPRKIKFYKTLSDENDSTSLEANDVNFILEHSSGKIFICELGGILEQIKSTNLLQDNLNVAYMKNYSINEGLVLSMIEDNQGYIWVIRESSIDKFDTKTGQLSAFGPNDFDYNMSFTVARPYHDPSTNNITVGTPMGALTFNPGTLKKSTYQPRIIFTTLHYNGEPEQHPILHSEKVIIPANKRNLTISFASLDYTRKYQTKYLYRLDGFTPEGEWINNGSSNMIGFNHIRHGNYVLKVKATNSHGIWSKYIAELPIEVRPTFWESIWGRIVLMLILVAIIGTIFYTYNQRQRENLSHDISIMKNEFFSDASHRLRTPLTLIGGPISQVLANEPGLTKQSRELLQIVERNAKEMLEMINKMLKFDNNSNFYVNGGFDEVNETDEQANEAEEGQINDQNVQLYLEEKEKEKQEEAERMEEHNIEKEDKQKEITILVVEDNNDLRKYLYTILSDQYNVLLAENGKAGLLIARKNAPDFILTDVTMPVMDGITMVHYLKQDLALKNIPILVLSAKASAEDQLKGFEEGIDAYLTKPFSVNYLLGRIEAVINKRRAIQIETIQKLKAEGNQNAIAALHILPTNINKAQTDKPADPAETKDRDKAFMSVQVNDALVEKLINYIIDNITSPDLKIDEISDAMGMSRSVLYNRLKTGIGMTPSDFVRHIRIMKATEYLRDTDDTLTTIAFNVGFTDPKYFSKVFKKEIGVVPSEYRERTRKV